jgi:hypothetical protein
MYSTSSNIVCLKACRAERCLFHNISKFSFCEICLASPQNCVKSLRYFSTSLRYLSTKLSFCDMFLASRPNYVERLGTVYKSVFRKPIRLY